MRGDDEMEKSDRYDALIDRALRSYWEPREMPETRVVLARAMERAREADSLRRSVWATGWAVAATCLVVAVVSVVWLLQRPRVPETAWLPKAPAVTHVAGSPVTPMANIHTAEGKNATQPTGEPGLRVASAAVTRQLPKLDVFPTPRPLGPQEKELVAFAMRAPPAARKAVIDDQQHWDDPIIVAELQDPSPESGSHQDQ